jgi:hypothetical protein
MLIKYDINRGNRCGGLFLVLEEIKKTHLIGFWEENKTIKKRHMLYSKGRGLWMKIIFQDLL